MGAFGSIAHGYTYQVATDPSKGGGNPVQHDARGPETAPNRAAAQAPGGWQPETWGGLGSSPTSYGPRPLQDHHFASGSHFGPRGRGDALEDRQLKSSDHQISVQSQPESLARMGAAGAAHGGVRAKGSSLPWANPLGIRLGVRRTPLSVLHAADKGSLHFNRPRIRPFPDPGYLHERNSPFPGAMPSGRVATSPYNPMTPGRPKGMQTPHLRRIMRPYGLGEYDLTQMDPLLTQADSGAIGGEWAR